MSIFSMFIVIRSINIKQKPTGIILQHLIFAAVMSYTGM